MLSLGPKTWFICSRVINSECYVVIYLHNDMQNFTSHILYLNIICITQWLLGAHFEILHYSDMLHDITDLLNQQALSSKHVSIFLTMKIRHISIPSQLRAMHMSPAKHSYAWLPRKCDYRTDACMDRRTDWRRTKWSLCAAMLRRWHNKPLKYELSFTLFTILYVKTY